MILSFTEKNQRQASGASTQAHPFWVGLLSYRADLDVSDFKRVDWLPVEGGVWKTALGHIFEILHNLSAPYLLSEIGRTADVHSYNTPSSQYNLIVPQGKSQDQKCFCI